MPADKHPAEVLADKLDAMRDVDFDGVFAPSAAALIRIPALEAERDTYRARLDRAIAAAEEHFGEDAIRYKLSLFMNGRSRNIFPQSMDGRWVALQRADNDAHIGLSLRVVEAEAERDRLTASLEKWVAASAPDGWISQMSAERDQLRAEVETLRADAERYRWLRTYPNNINPSMYGPTMVMGSGLLRRDTYLDAAIDAARKEAP